jgi:hypothetical protein
MHCTRGDKIQGFLWDTSQIILLIGNGCLGRVILRVAPKSRGRTAFALLSAFKGGTKELRATSPWLSCTLVFEDRELPLIGASEEIKPRRSQKLANEARLEGWLSLGIRPSAATVRASGETV